MNTNQNIKNFYARVFSDTNLYQVDIFEEEEFRYGAQIIIKTEFGENIAVINGWKTNSLSHKKSYRCGHIIRYATKEDLIKREKLDLKSVIIKAQINSMIANLGLSMNLTNLIIPLSEESICIYYTALERVDFRVLLKDLKNKYKMKIVMRQINQKERLASFIFNTDIYENEAFL